LPGLAAEHRKNRSEWSLSLSLMSAGQKSANFVSR